MQKLTISGTELETVVKYLYPELNAPRDFAAEKYSDNEDLFLVWKTDVYPIPTDAELKQSLELANKAKEENAKAQEAEAEAKATQKAALLDRLGITEDEAKLLLA